MNTEDDENFYDQLLKRDPAWQYLSEKHSRARNLAKLEDTLRRLDDFAKSISPDQRVPSVLRFLAYEAMDAVIDYLGSDQDLKNEGPTHLLLMTRDLLQSYDLGKMHPLRAKSTEAANRAISALNAPDIQACAAACLEYLVTDCGESKERSQTDIAKILTDENVRPPGESGNFEYGGDAIRKWRERFATGHHPSQMLYDFNLLVARKKKVSRVDALSSLRDLVHQFGN